MTKKRRMPVDVLGPVADRPGDDAVIEGLLTPPAPEPPGAPGRASATDRDEERRLRQGEDKVGAWALGTLLIGLLPWLAVALPALVAIQAALLKDLAASVGSPWRPARGWLTALAGSIPLLGLGFLLAWPLGLLPWVGGVAGPISRALGAAAATYLVGRVYLKDCAAGGTLLGLDARAMLAHFRAKYGPRAG